MVPLSSNSEETDKQILSSYFPDLQVSACFVHYVYSAYFDCGLFGTAGKMA
jgi:hypothetical protein